MFNVYVQPYGYDRPSTPSISPASFTAAKNQNQWSSLSISREAPYVGDENICQYGYGICGLELISLVDEP